MLEEVHIQGVRGIRSEVGLSLRGKSLVLRGDNGTGKSSIVAALAWALRGDKPPSTAAKAGSEESYQAHVLDGAQSARVAVRLKGGGAITVTA